MPYDISPEERQAVLSLNSRDRYRHAVSRIADWEEVWTLRDRDGFVLMANDEGTEVVPIWPHPEYAICCTADQWSAARPESIPLDDFMQKWIPGMQNDERLVSVFPSPAGPGMTVIPNRLGHDLETELQQYT